MILSIDRGGEMKIKGYGRKFPTLARCYSKAFIGRLKLYYPIYIANSMKVEL